MGPGSRAVLAKPAVSATFDPLSGTPYWWFDASDAASITLNVSAVSQMNDKSGSNLHVSQATGASQPAYITAAQNGLNVVRFNSGGGTDDFLSRVTGINGGAALTFIIALKWNAVDSFPTIISSGDNGGAQFRLESAKASLIRSGVGGIGADTVFTHATTNPVVMSVVYTATTQLEYFSNGAAGTSTTPSANLTGSTNGFGINLNNAFSRSFDWYEGFRFNRALGSTERAAYEAYLKAKWATP